MEEEFVQMQFYLDSRQAREEFKKKIGKRILPPPLPPFGQEEAQNQIAGVSTEYSPSSF